MAFFRRKSAPKRPGARKEWARRQLQRIAILPSLLTLANGVCGLAAIHQVAIHYTRTAVEAAGSTVDQAGVPAVGWPALDGFGWAAVLIVLAMVADSLDGRVARFTRQTTDFGGQLDSLSDVVSFGLAPAFIVHHLVLDLSRTCGWLGTDGGGVLSQLAWLAGAGYFSCAALRLARFNVENIHDESAHLWFKGLPSPGAAAGVVALILIRHASLQPGAPSWAAAALAVAAPAVTLTLALLMVSRIRYPHVVNQYLAGRHSFGYLARLVLVIVGLVTVMIATRVEYAAAAGILGYVYGVGGSGLLRQLRGEPPPGAAPVPAEGSPATPSGSQRLSPPTTETGAPATPSPASPETPSPVPSVPASAGAPTGGN